LAVDFFVVELLVAELFAEAFAVRFAVADFVPRPTVLPDLGVAGPDSRFFARRAWACSAESVVGSTPLGIVAFTSPSVT
jgi:hypothetical protein